MRTLLDESCFLKHHHRKNSIQNKYSFENVRTVPGYEQVTRQKSKTNTL